MTSEETFRYYLDEIIDAMNVSCIDYDKLDHIMREATTDFINNDLTCKQFDIITRWIKNLTLVKDKK